MPSKQIAGGFLSVEWVREPERARPHLKWAAADGYTGPVKFYVTASDISKLDHARVGVHPDERPTRGNGVLHGLECRLHHARRSRRSWKVEPGERLVARWRMMALKREAAGQLNKRGG